MVNGNEMVRDFKQEGDRQPLKLLVLKEAAGNNE